MFANSCLLGQFFLSKIWMGQINLQEKTFMTGINILSNFGRDTIGNWPWQSSPPKCHWDSFFLKISPLRKKGHISPLNTLTYATVETGCNYPNSLLLLICIGCSVIHLQSSCSSTLYIRIIIVSKYTIDTKLSYFTRVCTLKPF